MAIKKPKDGKWLANTPKTVTLYGLAGGHLRHMIFKNSIQCLTLALILLSVPRVLLSMAS